MAEAFRIATYNCEWFNNLFDDHGRLLSDSGPSVRYKTTRREQLDALGIVFNALDADAVMVIEAPDTNGKRSSVKALERFAATMGIRARRAVTGYRSETEQEITVLFDPDRLDARHDPQGIWPQPAGSAGVPRFDGQFRAQVDQTGPPDVVRFAKPPLELAMTTSGGTALRIIGAHIKSKTLNGAKGPEAALRLARANRRKQLGQCLWLRARVDEHLLAGDSLIVLGDFNDGPGIDEYEAELGRSGVEVTLGTGDAIRLHDPHAQMALATHVGIKPSSARFYMAPAKQFFEAMLDFIMVSPDLVAKAPNWRIWHPFNDPACWKVPELRDALLAASDHFPVTIDVVL
jgi:endonuclease/exonuclease/phosphatase family metal-dependent hydrolase